MGLDLGRKGQGDILFLSLNWAQEIIYYKKILKALPGLKKFFNY